MAQHQVGDLESAGIVSKAKAVAGSVATPGNIYATPGNYVSNTALDTRLAAVNAALYPQSQLDKMTANDKIYALRLNDDPQTL